MKKDKEKKLVKDKELKLARDIILTEKAPKAIGPYSQGIALKKIVFFSGQIAIDPITGLMVEGGIAEQTRQVLSNINELLLCAEMTKENVVKTTVYITDMEKFSEFNTEYATYFDFEPPARSCAEVSKLPMNALVEIEVIASRI